MNKFRLPPLGDMSRLETRAVLRAAAQAEAALGELKGSARTIPNKDVLLNTLPLLEASASSEIENIVTTRDELFRSQIDDRVNGAAKEVHAHSRALIGGYDRIRKNGLLRLSDIEYLQSIIVGNEAGVRTQEGTVLKNSKGETVYTPPPCPQLRDLLDNLIRYINDPEMDSCTPLVKMAIIHHQFESIHPFYDGNGRVGRVINLLYLVLRKRLDLPALYLSRYILTNKESYYNLLQDVRKSQNWEAWLLYMLKGLGETAGQTMRLIGEMNKMMRRYKHRIRDEFPGMYSQDLINALFSHPYTRIDFLRNALRCSRQSASNYLNRLSKVVILEKRKIGRSNIYVNGGLVDILTSIHTIESER